MSKSSITLTTGDEISMSSMSQHFTYDGLMEGIPNPEINQGIMSRHRDLFPPACHSDVPSLLIEPKIEPGTDRENAMVADYGFRVEYLPPVIVVACFSLVELTEHTDDIYRLRLIWYQHELGDIAVILSKR